MRSTLRVAQLSIAFAVVGLVVLAGSGPAGARGTRTLVCGSSDHHLVVARDVQAEVYRAVEPDLEFYGYWGCVYGSRRSFRLGIELISGSPYASFGVRNVTLAGDAVAYETSFSTSPGGVNESPGGEVGTSEWHVVVVNLLSGRMLYKVPTGVSIRSSAGVIGAGETRAIALKSNGSVAWINDTFQKENRFEVHALDKTGERVLAVGSNIAAESLALAGSTLYWTQGGKPFSTVLQ